MKLLIDADVFIGLLNRDDALHHKTIKVVSLLSKEKRLSFFCTWEVIVEAATKLSRYLGVRYSEDLFNFLSDNNITIIYPEFETAQQAIALFRAQTTKNISLTDCMNVIVYQFLKVDGILSCDQWYKKSNLIDVDAIIDSLENRAN